MWEVTEFIKNSQCSLCVMNMVIKTIRLFTQGKSEILEGVGQCQNGFESNRIMKSFYIRRKVIENEL